MNPLDLTNVRRVRVNDPGSLTHGLLGHTDISQARDGYYVVDIDGLEGSFHVTQLLFIEHVKVPDHDRPIYVISTAVLAFVVGFLCGWAVP